MARRKGQAKGQGKGYKNLRNFPKDPKVHSDSARGWKQPQKIPSFMMKSEQDYQKRKQNLLNSLKELEKSHGELIRSSKEESVKDLLKFMIELKKDYNNLTQSDLQGIVSAKISRLKSEFGLRDEDLPDIENIILNYSSGAIPELDLAVEWISEHFNEERPRLASASTPPTPPDDEDEGYKNFIDSDTAKRHSKMAKQIKPFRRWEHYQSKKNRDKRFKELKEIHGDIFRKTSSRGQQLHPEYVKDYEDEIETGIGNTQYKTLFPVLYNIEFKYGHDEGDLK